MIQTILENPVELPFFYEQKDSVIISESSVVTDLFFLAEFNGLVLKNYSAFESVPKTSMRHFVEIQKEKDIDKLVELGLNDDFSQMVFELMKSLSSSLIGVQVTNPQIEMCPNIHIDKLPLRLVQCLDGPGTTLYTSNNETILTEKNDIVFIKGETWASVPGALKHRSPDCENPRRLLRIDFLD